MKKLGLDLDSVLAEIMDPLISYYNDTYGTALTLPDYRFYNLTNTWNCTVNEAIDRVYDFYRSPYFDRILPVEGAVGAVDRLSEDYEITIITSRPHFITESTDRWVQKFFPKKISGILHTNQFSKKGSKTKLKSDFCIELGITTFVDDHLDYALDCAEKNIRVFLYDMPWNQKKELHKNIIRVKKWSEITEYL